MLMGGMKMKGTLRGSGNWGDERSIKSCIIHRERLDANINRGIRTTEVEGLFQYFTLVIEKTGGGSYMGGCSLRLPLVERRIHLECNKQIQRRRTRRCYRK